jgi:hypothetical protein
VGAETAAAQIYLGVTFTALGFALIAFFHRYADRDLMHWHSVSNAQFPYCILGVYHCSIDAMSTIPWLT